MNIKRHNTVNSIFMVILFGLAAASMAAPLPNNTLLAVKAGSGSGVGVRCTTGSCVGTLLSPGIISWQDITPGVDGGWVIGKQQSFFQDTTFINYCQMAYATNATTGQVACFVTAPSAENNFFADVSCTGAGCVGITEVKSLSINGVDSLSGACPPGASCPGVTHWGVTRPFGTNPPPISYSLDYQWASTSGAYLGLPIYLHFAGDIVYRSSPPIARIFPESFQANSGDTVTLDGSTSYDPDPYGTIACHAWSAPGIILPTVCAPSISFTAPAVTEVTILPVTLTVTDQSGAQGSATAVVTISPRTQCQNNYPIRRITTDGGGGGAAINSTLTATFTGHIVSNTKSRLVVCRDTTVDYEIASSVGQAHCLLNGYFAPPIGKLRPNGKLVCSNLPDGEDVDKYSIVAY
jgi:hypothetical protein